MQIPYQHKFSQINRNKGNLECDEASNIRLFEQNPYTNVGFWSNLFFSWAFPVVKVRVSKLRNLVWKKS